MAQQSVKNIFSNALAPLDFNKTGRLIGTAEYVAAEVIVSKIVRSVLRMENRGIMELALIHLISIPFLGGVGAPFPAQASITNQAAGYGRAVADGAKGIPAVLVAQWILQTAYKGFHFPWFSMKDLLVTAGSKTITRPIVYSFAAKLPTNMADGLRVIDELYARQRQVSNLNMDRRAAGF